MGNVTSKGGSRGRVKSFRRQQKQHPRHQAATPTTTTTSTSTSTSQHYQTPQQLLLEQRQQQQHEQLASQQISQYRLKASNKRNKQQNRRQQQPRGRHLYPLTAQYPIGGQDNHHHNQHHHQHQHQLRQHQQPSWSAVSATSSNYFEGDHLRGEAHHRSTNHHQAYLDDLYGSHPVVAASRVQAPDAVAPLRSELVSPAASYELLSSRTHSSSSSTVAAGQPPLQQQQQQQLHHHNHQLLDYNNYDAAPYTTAQPHQFLASRRNYHLSSSSSSHHHHRRHLSSCEDCEPSVTDSPFNQPHLAGVQITQPPLHCQDSCCNPTGSKASTSATTTTNTNTTTTTTTRARRMNQSSQKQVGAGQRRSDSGNGSSSDDHQNRRRLNPAIAERGLALGETERKQRGLTGLLPVAVQGQELQARVVMSYIEQCQDELAKYVYLRNLKDFNESLFYYTLTRNVERLMPLVYTPTVGLACQRFSQIFMRPRGLFVSAKDAGCVSQVVANWPERDVRVIVVTDGERILGLGDLGANGMGISIGKLSLYTALAGISPQNVLPVTIDVGTNNEFNLEDPFYIGLRQRRVRGEKYDALVEEFMQACVKRWGRSCLIQFEDFANSTAFDLLERYRRDYCTFNDDIQGTASVSVSGLITAARLVGRRLSDCSFLFYGAGEANLGTANLLIMAMIDDGLTRDEAKKRIWLVDSKGLVVKSREDLNAHKRSLAQDSEHIRDLEQIVDLVKPLAIVGASAQSGSFSESICRKMAEYNERPVIFALSNPTSKAECTAEQAYEWTRGTCVFASGSPFEPVKYDGRTYITGQGNNAYIFPGVGLAAIAAHTHIVPEEIFLVAARALSDQVTSEDTQVGLVYPRLTKIREVTLKVATRVLEFLYAERLATYRPEPSDKQEFLKSIQYDPSY